MDNCNEELLNEAPRHTVFVEAVQRIKLQASSRRYLPKVTAQWIAAEESSSPEYWIRHLRQAVRFSRAVEELLEDTNWMLVEVSPGRTLKQTARRHARRNSSHTFFSTLCQRQRQHLGILLGQLWQRIDSIAGLYSQQRRRRTTNPFGRRRYWTEAQKPGADLRAQQKQWLLSDL
jgi:acyl transferase domain-containing protein